MIIELLQRLTTTDRHKTYKHIMDLYISQGYCIIHFMYFASISRIIQYDLYNKPLTIQDQGYYNALMAGDIILPDGIALQLLYYTRTQRNILHPKTRTKRLPNLNGTDFLPYMISQLQYDYGQCYRIRFILFGGYAQNSAKIKEYLTQRGCDVMMIQDGFNPFDRHILSQHQVNKQENDIRIMLHSRGGLKAKPMQEIRCEEYKSQIQRYQLLVFTVGGLFDFWAGKEKRAPRIIRILKGEWIWRLIQYPKKNRNKFLSSFLIFPTLFAQKVLKHDRKQVDRV